MNLQALDLMLGQKGTVNPKELSPLALAYIGDAVYEMLVRTTVLTGGNAPVNRLHKTARDMVNAKAQAEFYFRVAEELTEEEAAVFRRGRNAKSYTTAKNASVADYRRATGFEALMGYLYMTGQTDRMLALIKDGIRLAGLEI